MVGRVSLQPRATAWPQLKGNSTSCFLCSDSMAIWFSKVIPFSMISVFSLVLPCILVTQSCLTLCNPMNCSPPGSSIHGILQARILEWVGSHSILQGIFLTRGLNPALLHCRQILYHLSHQFGSVAQSCPTLCNPMNRSMPGLPVHHQLPEFTQIHVHQLGDAIQPSHPQSSPSPPAPNPSQHQGLFQRVNSSHEVAQSIGVSASASVLPKNTQDWSPLGWTGWISLKSKGLSRVFSNTTV